MTAFPNYLERVAAHHFYSAQVVYDGLCSSARVQVYVEGQRAILKETAQHLRELHCRMPLDGKH